MITYTGTLANTPPISDALRSEAMDGMRRKSPWKYPSQHGDIMRALGQENAVNFDRAATKANTDYQLEQQKAERELALSGLGQMAQAQQQQQQLANSRMQSALGMYSGLLSGLFN